MNIKEKHVQDLMHNLEKSKEKYNTANSLVQFCLYKEVISFCKAIIKGEIPFQFPELLSKGLMYQHEIGLDVEERMYLSQIQHTMNDYGYYTKVTEVFCKELGLYLRGKTVLDPFSGNGMLARGLRENGVNVIETDDKSWNISNKSSIEKLDAIEAVKKYGKELDYIILAWIPYENKKDLELLMYIRENNLDVKLIIIGECGGCTGSSEFWSEVDLVDEKDEEYKMLEKITGYYKTFDTLWESVYLGK